MANPADDDITKAIEKIKEAGKLAARGELPEPSMPDLCDDHVSWIFPPPSNRSYPGQSDDNDTE